MRRGRGRGRGRSARWDGGGYGYGGFGPYVSAAEKRARAQQAAQRLTTSGRVLAPVQVEGRKITRTFWGQAWCDNLEAYSDYANRLPRGRTYVRNGSVLDLQVAPGRVTALVAGSSLYEVTVTIRRLERPAWTALTRECAGKIDSVVELLAGRLSRGVMEVVSRRGGGLFPAPRELSLACSCPDYAGLCKHLAATLYGVGARLDERPELLFTLREVDPAELVEGVDASAALTKAASNDRVLAAADLGAVFGIELADDRAPEPAPAPRAPAPGVKPPAPAKEPRSPAKKTQVTAKATKVRAKKKPARPVTYTAQELLDRGVPRPTIQGWLRQGVLEPTDARGVYRATPLTAERLARYRA